MELLVTEEEYKKITDLLNNKDDDGLLRKVMITNSELMVQIYDLQEFMEEQGLTAEQFLTWKEKKDLRMYH